MLRAMADDIIGPSSSFFVSQRLRIHYVDWGNHDAPLLVLLHGGKDHARSWDWTARDLRRDYHVVAMDLRGHGDSAWTLGGTYSPMDHVLDLAQFLEMMGEFPTRIVAHSLGASVSLTYTGLYPEKVERLVCIEGMGPPPSVAKSFFDKPFPARARDWIEGTRGLAGRQPRRYESIEDAAKRMQQENAFLSDEQAEHLTRHAVARNEDGTYSWKFDQYTRPFSPVQMGPEAQQEIWGAISCPVLHIRGTESWTTDPAEDGRLHIFNNARVANVEGAGHWVHHDRLDEFLRLTRAFLADDS